MTDQPRVPAGLPGGGRFAPVACASAYAVLDALAARAEDGLPPGWTRDPDYPARILLPDPGRCPHGSFPSYAARNCCRPTAAGVLPLTGPGTCGQPTADGSRCTRRTTRTDRHGHPACHQHGGTTTAVA